MRSRTEGAMKLEGRRAVLKGALTLIPALVMRAAPALAASAAEIDREVDAAIKKALQAVPETRDIVAKSKGVLIFPRIYKAGFMFGAQYGEGAMRKKGTTVGYYNSVAASYGFQAGVQSFGYMLFFLTDHAVNYLEQSGGFELGSGPSLVVLDQGTAKSFSTSTAQKDIAAMFFDQKGLMGGVGLQGSKLSRMKK
jgi:lipid-binding SYLF domain-containing protein